MVRTRARVRGGGWVQFSGGVSPAKVVWAWGDDPEANRALLRYYPLRQAWLLEADDAHPDLTPYPRR